MVEYNQSKKLFDLSKKTLASGVSSSLRLAMKPIPLFIEKSKGVKLYDVDGNEYIDYIMAYGPQILGHSHSVVVNAVQRQVEKGQIYGAQHEGEIELSQRITKYVPCAEMVSFSSTGSEAVQTALRLARAYTGRRKIVKFDGHYHGWIDTIFTTFNSKNSTDKQPGTEGQNLAALEDVLVIPWNDEKAFVDVIEEHGKEIAAVITEPIMCNSGCIEPLPGFLEKVRDETSKKGIVLIFDEVITGFRLSLGGAQEYLQITPDLVTMGKAVAGGLPLSAVGGKKEIMSLIAENRINHMGTFNGNPISTASGIAAIDYLARDNGKVYKEMNHLASYFTSELIEIANQIGLPMVINQVGNVFHTMFTDLPKIQHYDQFKQRDITLFSKFAEKLLEEGVCVRPSGLWYLATEHSMEDMNQTLERAEKALKKIKNLK